MNDSDALDLFSDYLNFKNLGKAIEEMGLVENAPQEAVLAYEEYKKMMKEINEDDELSLF
jgi:hypothetical protein